MADLLALADEVDRNEGSENALDVRIEIALFEPDGPYRAIRANAAGTKVIFTRADGSEVTFLAEDWTMCRTQTAERLRERAGQREGAE